MKSFNWVKTIITWVIIIKYSFKFIDYLPIANFLDKYNLQLMTENLHIVSIKIQENSIIAFNFVIKFTMVIAFNFKEFTVVMEAVIKINVVVDFKLNLTA